MKQPSHVPLHPHESAVEAGGDQDVRQKLMPCWPGRRVVPRRIRDRRTQQPNPQDRQAGLLVRLATHNRGKQPVQLQGSGLDTG